MRRFVLTLTVLLMPAIFASAQNNPYDIDDECYVYFTAAEHSVDDYYTDAFETAQQNLLETALRKKDTKAQTLYYVEQLKHTSHLGQYERKKNPRTWDWQTWNTRVEKDRETLQRIAEATGYMQYYYYATELCQTYYFNTAQDLAATAMLQNVMSEARKTGDEYALLRSLMYLGKLYMRINDKYNTKKIMLEVVRIYETSQDPMIVRQSMTNQYCDLACTYPVASDSARLFFRKAENSCATTLDSLRVTYFNAQLAAWDGKISEYRKDRDICLSAAPFSGMIHGGVSCFECIDAVLGGKPAKQVLEKAGGLHNSQQTVYLYSLAEKLGQWECAALLMDKHINRLYTDIYHSNGRRLDETAAQYGNHKLSADLASASRKATRNTILVAVLLTLLLVGALLVALKHLRYLRKAYDKDEALIAGMKEKNE